MKKLCAGRQASTEKNLLYRLYTKLGIRTLINDDLNQKASYINGILILRLRVAITNLLADRNFTF